MQALFLSIKKVKLEICFLVQKNRTKSFLLFFENLNRDFGTLGIGIVQIRLQFRTRRPRIRLHANFGKFDCMVYIKNNQFAYFF